MIWEVYVAGDPHKDYWDIISVEEVKHQEDALSDGVRRVGV